MQRLSLTLAILKPDVFAHTIHHVKILDLISNEKFIIAKQSVLSWDPVQAEEFYSEHRGKFFQQRLVEFMSSGEFHALVLAHKREDAISKWRTMLGPTKCYQARQKSRDCIRSLYGLSDTRNAGHGSDSIENFEREVQFMFPGWDYKEWMADQRDE